MPDLSERTPRRVVIAEDEAIIRLDLAEMLREEGYDVIGQASNGEEALTQVQELKPDLVILDVRMPKVDGITVAEQVATERICPVIILTAFSDRELVERARDAGAMHYVVKPFKKEQLVPAIEIAVSRFEEVRELAKEVDSLTEQLATRKLVDRAKGLLQAKFDLSEPEAFRWIQKTAMDKRLSMARVAQHVIDETDNATTDGDAASDEGGQAVAES
ncbi:ANTAR domain-containing response regulator [Flindersiella endophytica]